MSFILAVTTVCFVGYCVARVWTHYRRKRARRALASLEHRMKSPADYADSPADWLERRAWVRARDNGRCVRCGGTAGLQVHHRVPRSREWNHSVDNLELLCVSCHSVEHRNRSRPGRSCTKAGEDKGLSTEGQARRSMLELRSRHTTRRRLLCWATRRPMVRQVRPRSVSLPTAV